MSNVHLIENFIRMELNRDTKREKKPELMMKKAPKFNNNSQYSFQSISFRLPLFTEAYLIIFDAKVQKDFKL